MPQYSTSFNVSSFNGINQSGDGYNLNMSYAREMENVDISGGGFKPMREGHKLEQTLHDPIGTLAYLHRRYGAEGTLLVAISNGSVYTKLLDGGDGWVERYTGLTVNDCDWVTYEVSLYANYSDSRGYALNERCMYGGAAYQCITAIPDAGEDWDSTHWQTVSGLDPVDILLLSNATDGMYCLYGDDCTVAPVATPKKFGVIARYNERIWGSGITDDPDMMVYSAPFDPFNWEAEIEIPEDGAGDILQPTWDGDSFLSLKQYGNTLLAIKRNSIWRISGTNPGEFTVQQQYGGGTIAENTIAVYNDYAYMMGEYGMMQYNGSGAFPFLQETTQTLMRNQLSRAYSAPEYSEDRSYGLGELCTHEGTVYRCISTIMVQVQQDGTTAGESWTPAHWEALTGSPLDNVCAGMWNGVYCLALPINGSPYCNAILQYDTANRTLSLRTGVSVQSFLQINERLFYTSATFPGTIFEMDDTRGKVLPVKWISGYQDLGVKSSIKSAFVVYMMVECETPVELWMGIRTERKIKEKRITLKPGKLTRTNLNTHGRVFRLEIRSYDALPYTIAGGIKVDLELDPD